MSDFGQNMTKYIHIFPRPSAAVPSLGGVARSDGVGLKKNGKQHNNNEKISLYI